MLGAHMSVAGGLHQAILRAAELRCTALQIFNVSDPANPIVNSNPIPEPAVLHLLSCAMAIACLRRTIKSASLLER